MKCGPSRRLLLCCLALALGACADRSKGPEIASSADSAGYAEHLPSELETLRERSDAQTAKTTEVNSAMREYPAALDEPDWDLVLSIYGQADAEGRSSAYVQHQREEAMLARFHEQERKPLVRRIAASNEYVAKEKGCDVQLWGATDRGLEKALEERLEERRRRDSDAHATIDREEEKLGKQNLETLHDQVDDIRMASYVVNIGLPLQQAEMRRMVDESKAAKSALEDHIETLKQRQEPDQEEIARAQEALAKIDPAVAKASAALQDAEQRTAEQKKKYEEAFEQLVETVEAAKDEQAKQGDPEG